MAEWLKAAVLKTVEGHTSGGSNPSLPATLNLLHFCSFYIFQMVYFNQYLQNYEIHNKDILTKRIEGMYNMQLSFV